jgi:hypothetical protein
MDTMVQSPEGPWSDVMFDVSTSPTVVCLTCLTPEASPQGDAMNNSKRFMLTSIVFLFGSTLSAYADTGTSQDSRITEAIKQAIAQLPDLKAPNQIYVDTRDHVVYLSGFVDSSLTTENAEQVARQTPGVVRVVNSISVDK